MRTTIRRAEAIERSGRAAVTIGHRMVHAAAALRVALLAQRVRQHTIAYKAVLLSAARR